MGQKQASRFKWGKDAAPEVFDSVKEVFTAQTVERLSKAAREQDGKK